MSRVYPVMRNAYLAALVLLLAFAPVGSASSATLVYNNTFSAPAGAEWGPNWMSSAPNGESYLGDFDFQNVTLRLTGLPAHDSVTIDFDVYTLNSWDGNDPTYGADLWTVSFGEAGEMPFTTTFSCYVCAMQSFPDAYPASHPATTGATSVNQFGFPHYYGDAVYHLELYVPHNATELVVHFQGHNQGMSYGWTPSGSADEGWGLDNVQVHVTSSTPPTVPTPELPTMALAGVGLAAIAILVLRRK